MIRYLLPAALAVALAAMGWALWEQRGRLSAEATVATLSRNVAVLEAQREQVRRAGQIAQAARNQLASEALQRDALIAELLALEGSDEPLSDYLRAGVGRLLDSR